MYHINQKILTRYILGKSSKAEVKAVEDWLDADVENKEMFRKFFMAQRAFFDLHLMDSIDTDEALIRIKTIVNRKKEKDKNRNNQIVIKQIAAVLLIPLFTLLGYFLPRADVDAISQLVEITSNPGVVSVCVLPDSSKVWLNSGSKLVYPLDFNQQKRCVSLSGEAYFNVRKGKGTFEVNIDSTYTINVLGTTFNVRAYEDEEYIKTSLVEGRVMLNYISSNGAVEHCCLKKYESSSYSKSTKFNSVEKTDLDVDVAWRYGQIVFDNHSLSHVLRVLERHYNVRFKVLNDEIYNSSITAKFGNEQLPQVLNYIKEATGIKYKFNKLSTSPDGAYKNEIILFK